MSDVLDIVRAQRPERPTLDAATREQLRARATGELRSEALTDHLAPTTSTHRHPQRTGRDETVRLDEVRDPRRRSKRGLAAVTGTALVVGGFWWLSSMRAGAPATPADEPTVATAPNAGPTTTPTVPPSTTVAGPGPFPLDGLDPLEAAGHVSLAARIDPTPDERADLTVAGEIMRRDCLRDGGANPPVLTSTEHEAVRDRALEELRQRTRLFTTVGLESLRVDGFFPDSSAVAESSESDPLWLPVTEGSDEAQLLAGGCGWVDEPLRAGPVERELNNLRAIEVDGDRTGSRWADIELLPENLPEFADQFPAVQACMSDAGYPNVFDPDVEPKPWAEFIAEPGVTEKELDMANAFAHCSVATNLPIAYVTAVNAVLEVFDEEYQAELAALRVERDTALEQARTILIDHGLNPFTT